MRTRFSVSLLALFAVTVGSLGVASESSAKADGFEAHLKHLKAGKLAAGEKALAAYLEENPEDDVARLELGITQFLRTWEVVSSDLYQHGLRTDRIQMMPFGIRHRLPLHPDPKVLTAGGLREILQRMVNDLTTAEATLAKITSDDLKMELPVEEIKLDLLGDGKPIPVKEMLMGLRNQRARPNPMPVPPLPFVVAIDRGDVHWLRGYCHFLAGCGEVMLAHDGTEFFHRVGHLMFQRPDTPYDFIRDEVPDATFRFDTRQISDLIAAIHLLRFPIHEPNRMENALEHFEAMLAQSKIMWKHYQAETDDNREWIPNPKQTGVLGVPVTQKMLDTWLETVTAAEEVLKGEKLVPFWRGKPRGDYGLNLRKVFTEPQELDLILWVQGTAAAPYLEDGKVTPLASPEHLQRINRDFGMSFFGFAVWFN
ncbi:MAG: hypothetical protein WD045_13935 [Pirellulaceae bacterium]